jgi:hypothetical protein
VINNILGLLTLAVVGWLAWVLFKNRLITVATLVLGGAFGPRIVCSVVPLSEILFAFFLIGGITFFARWLERPRPGRLLIGAALTTLSAGVRYEGWIFVAGMGLISLIIIRKQRSSGTRHRISLALCTGAILCAAPVAWVILLAVQKLNLWEVFIASARFHALADTSSGSFAVLWKQGLFSQFFYRNLESLNILGVFGVVSYGLVNRNMRKWLWFLLSSFVGLGVLALLGFAVPAHNYWRTSLIWSLLIIPFCAYWIIGLGRNLGQGRKYPAFLLSLIFVSLFLFFFCRQTAKMTRYSNMDGPDINAGKFAGSYISCYQEDTRPRIFVDWAGWHYAHVMVASRCPSAFSGVHLLGRLVRRNQLELDKLERYRVALLIVHRKNYSARRHLFSQLKPAYINARWVIFKIP